MRIACELLFTKKITFFSNLAQMYLGLHGHYEARHNRWWSRVGQQEFGACSALPADSKGQLQTEVLIELCLRGWNGHSHASELLEQRLAVRGSSTQIMLTILRCCNSITGCTGRTKRAVEGSGRHSNPEKRQDVQDCRKHQWRNTRIC